MRSRTGFFILCLALLAAAAARADTVIQPLGDYELNTNVELGFGIVVGETIRVPTNGDTRLVSFAIGIVAAPDSIANVNLLGEVYAWDGSKATGSALFTSPPTPIATSATDPTFAPFPTFETGGINLTAGAEYVIFLDVVTPGGAYSENILQSGAGYADGAGVIIRSGDPAVWTSEDWGGAPQIDFVATFAAPAPEAPTWLLLTAGFLGLGAAGFQWKRRWRGPLPDAKPE